MDAIIIDFQMVWLFFDVFFCRCGSLDICEGRSLSSHLPLLPVSCTFLEQVQGLAQILWKRMPFSLFFSFAIYTIFKWAWHGMIISYHMSSQQYGVFLGWSHRFQIPKAREDFFTFSSTSVTTPLTIKLQWHGNNGIVQKRWHANLGLLRAQFWVNYLC